jgi:hypothetical protein
MIRSEDKEEMLSYNVTAARHAKTCISRKVEMEARDERADILYVTYNSIGFLSSGHS